MEAKEVMALLHISRGTLANYLRDGKLKAVRMANNRWDYDDATVYELLTDFGRRRVYGYVCVEPGPDADERLNSQIECLNAFCLANHYDPAVVMHDISDNFDNRPGFFRILENLFSGKVQHLIVLSESSLHDLPFLCRIFGYWKADIIVADLT